MCMPHPPRHAPTTANPTVAHTATSLELRMSPKSSRLSAKLDAVETPEAALKAMRASYWGDRLGGLQSPHACAGATPA